MLSTQAIILAVCNALVFIAIALSMFVLKKESDANVTKSDRIITIVKNVTALIMFAIIMALQVYSLNCMIYGDCQLWTWIITVFAVLGTLSYLGFFVYLVATFKKVEGSVQTTVQDIRTFGASAPPVVSTPPPPVSA